MAPDHRGAESDNMFRWQGRVDALLDEHGKRLDQINGDAKAARTAAEQILVQLAVMRTKIALWATIGGLVGAGIVSFVASTIAGG